MSWEAIAFESIELGDQIGGGGVGLIYKGYYNRRPVALKTLVKSYIE